MDPIIDDSQFNTDNKAFLAASKEVQDQITQAGNDEDVYRARLGKLSSNSELALLQLFFMLYASPGDDTFGGYFQNRIGIVGAQLKLNGALTAVGNDLNNMINSNNDNPGSLRIFANDASTLMQEVKNLPDGDMNPETQKSVLDNLTTIRKYFNISDAAVPGDNPQPGDTYYFSDQDTKFITSFAEYQTLLGQQGDGKNSTEAAKYITDDFATNTQSTQTASAVLNNDMKTLSPILQAVQQFDSAIAQLINAIKKASINHTASGS